MKLKKMFLSVVAGAFLLAPIAFGAISQAAILPTGQFGATLLAAPGTPTDTSPFSGSKSAACQGVEFDESATCNNVKDSASGLTGLLKIVLNLLSLIVGVAAIVMIIVAGLKYVTSQGDASQVSSAKNTLLYAIVGLIIVAMAQVIVVFVLKQTTKKKPASAGSTGLFLLTDTYAAPYSLESTQTDMV